MHYDGLAVAQLPLEWLSAKPHRNARQHLNNVDVESLQVNIRFDINFHIPIEDTEILFEQINVHFDFFDFVRFKLPVARSCGLCKLCGTATL